MVSVHSSGAGPFGSPLADGSSLAVLVRPDADPRRAAQYVRMSTDHQQYSTANQRDAIARYAAARGMEVVKTYADEGRSGLTFAGRPGLQALLNDVIHGRADFRTVLVLDVSRWGRFQDTDESACYEYLCRRAGIRVEYCAEPFTNDGTPMSSVMKGLKRVMAGEYSRELSDKVLTAKCRVARMGYRVGGLAGYGYRRMLLDRAGNPRGVMEDGQQKFAADDRVVLVPGPEQERAVVRWIFTEVARRGRGPTSLAASLNRRGIPRPDARPWRMAHVLDVLNNEKYMGTLIFNRKCSRLQTRPVLNPKDRWVRVDGAFPALVPPALFRRAQAARASWKNRTTPETGLSQLRALLAREGKLSTKILKASNGVPHARLVQRLFGSVLRAYQLVGYRPKRDYAFLAGRRERARRREALREEALLGLRQRGATARLRAGGVILVNDRLRVLVRVTRAAVPWPLRVKGRPRPDWVLIARLDASEAAVQDYWLAAGLNCITFKPGHRDKRPRHQSLTLGPLLDVLAGACPRPNLLA